MPAKKITAGAAVLAVTLVATVNFLEGSRAVAQDAAPIVHQHPETAPQVEFVPNEVVQALPEPAPEEVAPEASSLRELVAQMPNETSLDEEMRCLAGAIYFESRGEPLAGQLAVAEVIINRAASHQFPADYCGVVYQRSQFSFVKNGRMPNIRTGSAAWKRARAIAQIAHKGLWDSEAVGSLFFHARSVAPSWRHKRHAMATISRHVFYK
ncbi:cell wall hydrolase [Qipengyuania sp.]|uniref:cell wall hydrolase n=1 Tax=Qipengyuania sp. TaxID=2004515 RepID=UPI0035C78FE5